MDYRNEKLVAAQKAIKKVRQLSEIFCPTDGWMPEGRAIEANRAWQEMMSCLDRIGVEVAKETMNFPCDNQLTCLRCGYSWTPELNHSPKTCPNPKCRSPYWNKPRQG